MRSSRIKSYFRYGSCQVNERSGLASFMAGDCLRQSDVKPNILLLGDSHAANLWSALTNRYAEYNFLQANGVGCKPLLSTSGAQKCVDLNRYIFDEWLSADGKKIEYVMLAAQWSLLATSGTEGNDRLPEFAGQESVPVDRRRNTLSLRPL